MEERGMNAAFSYDLAKWVTEARKATGMTQEAFAFELGFSTKASVNAIEKGRNKPTFETMIKISEISGVPLPYQENAQTETLKDRLQTLMSEYNLSTQQELADFAGVSKGLVGQWFNGQTGLGRKPLVAFERKTNFSPRWLADGDGEKYRNQPIAVETLAERITAVLKTKGISVNALARQVGVSYPAMRKITKGETLNPKFLFEIAEALDVPIEWLKTGRGAVDLPASAEMDTLAKRLKATMKTRGVNQTQLAEAVGVSQRSISKITDGQTLNPKFIVEIAEVLDVPVEWLKTGRETADMAPLSDGIADGIAFELLNVQAAAGVGYFNDDFPEPLSRLVFSEHWVREHLGGTGKAVKLISVKGDSMSPTFNHGDFLFVDTAADFYNGEGVYVFAAAGELRVKRLQSSVRGGMNVISDNRNYNAEYLPPDDWAAVKVCGRVVYRLAGERV
ncbi:helix-turn-helix domain-containing protein [Neisseria lactamica]|uniref:helix-turn-helix domain-containing protein n=1 Tax=Neisseria lactamica TaxID=486 RepID=UPI000E580880